MRNRQAAISVGSAVLIGLVMVLAFQNCGGKFTSSSASQNANSSLAGYTEVFVEFALAGAPTPREAKLQAANVQKVSVVITSTQGTEAKFTWERKAQGDVGPTIAALQALPGPDRLITAQVEYVQNGETKLYTGQITGEITSDQIYTTLQLSPSNP